MDFTKKIEFCVFHKNGYKFKIKESKIISISHMVPTEVVEKTAHSEFSIPEM